MAYNIFISDKAQFEIENIVNYMHNVLMSKQAANNFLNNLESTYSRIADFPNSFSNFKFSKNIRRAIIGNYVIIYQVDNIEKIVNILRVAYAQRDFDNFDI